jgi:superfamily II DNA or RNA helicase
LVIGHWGRNIILAAVARTLYDFIPRGEEVGNDTLLGCFLEYTQSKGLELYPAQESAILEIFEEKNVILNTPTGSGKSLVAAAVQFKALAQGKRSVYTCPIKALVNEKWMALCREFGPHNVGPKHRGRLSQSGGAYPLLHRRDPGKPSLTRRSASRLSGNHHG